MPKRFASDQMLNSHHYSRVAPPRRLKCVPGRGEAFHLGKKSLSVISGKGDERCSCVTEASAAIVREESPERSRLAVTICAHHHEGGFGEALGLEPRAAAPDR